MGRGFKFEVSSAKYRAAATQFSGLKPQTSHFKLGRRPFVRNKPNFPRDRVSGFGAQLWRVGCRAACGKTKPISPSRLGRPWYSRAGRPCYGTPYGVTADRASAPNEPNFGAGGRKDKCRADKELRRMGCRSNPGKTKPIQR